MGTNGLATSTTDGLTAGLTVDALVIGGGVVGCAIVRELARLDATVALVERRLDICDATSKANSAIVHTGFDAPPGTLEARLLADSRALWPEVIRDLGITYRRTGAVMLATTAAEQEAIAGAVMPKAARNGVAVRPLTRAEVLDLAPYATPATVGGLLIDGEAIVDPFWTARAYCEDALRAGARVVLGQAVDAITVAPDRLVVHTDAGATITASLVVNAAGLWADEVARLAGDASLRITPRKGQFIVTKDDPGVEHIILPVPSKVTKGMLVTPAVFGGILLGPTAEDIADKSDVATTAEGLERIRAGVARLVPVMAVVSSVRQYAGVRAVGSDDDYIIRPSPVSPRLLHVAGIRSTGLSASPGIGLHVASLVRERLGLVPRCGATSAMPERDAGMDDGESGAIVCLCRGVTRGEVVAALRGPLPPLTLDGLKRRTGVMLGECQGNICIPALLDLFHEQSGREPATVPRGAPGSSPVAGHTQLIAPGTGAAYDRT